jgi:hypothetical protein
MNSKSPTLPAEPRLDSLHERFAYNRQDLARSARLRRLKVLQQNGEYPRKLLILLGLVVLAFSFGLFSSIFGDLTRSF